MRTSNDYKSTLRSMLTFDDEMSSDSSTGFVDVSNKEQYDGIPVRVYLCSSSYMLSSRSYKQIGVDFDFKPAEHDPDTVLDITDYLEFKDNILTLTAEGVQNAQSWKWMAVHQQMNVQVNFDVKGLISNNVRGLDLSGLMHQDNYIQGLGRQYMNFHFSGCTSSELYTLFSRWETTSASAYYVEITVCTTDGKVPTNIDSFVDSINSWKYKRNLFNEINQITLCSTNLPITDCFDVDLRGVSYVEYVTIYDGSDNSGDTDPRQVKLRFDETKSKSNFNGQTGVDIRLIEKDGYRTTDFFWGLTIQGTEDTKITFLGFYGGSVSYLGNFNSFNNLNRLYFNGSDIFGKSEGRVSRAYLHRHLDDIADILESRNYGNVRPVMRL